MSYTFKGTNDFTSIPGLVLWLDGRRGKTVVANKIIGWNSLTPDGRLFNTKDADRRADNLDQWVSLDDEAGVLQKLINSPKSDKLNFFHNGSPFGYFEIMAYKHAETSITSRSFTTRSGGNDGANVAISGGGSGDGRIMYQLVDGGVQVVGVQTATSLLLEEVVNSVAVTRNSLSEANNFKIYIQNIIRLQTTVSQFTASTGNIISNTATEKKYLIGLKLLYDWTGFTSTQVEVFSTNVRALIEQEKTLFTYPV